MSKNRYCIKKPYFSRARYRYYDDIGNEDEYQKEVYIFARQLINKHNLRSIIDIGCGSGYKLINYLGEYETLGIEVSRTYNYLVQEYPNRHWMKSDFNKGKDLSADLVICADVIEHLIDPDSLVSFISDIDSRFIIFSTPSRDVIYNWWNTGYWGPPRNRHHVREWNFVEFNEYVSQKFRIRKHLMINKTNQLILCQLEGLHPR